MTDPGGWGRARIEDAGLSIPEDLAVIGVDSHDLAETMDLTTIHQDVDQHGVVSARCLVELLEGGGSTGGPVEVDTSLVLRGTT